MSLTITGVGHKFAGGTWLFQGVNEHLIPGMSYAVTGPSGSGKSTLLQLLAGWLQPVEGTITYSPEVQRTRWVFQHPTGVPGRTALDHVRLPLLARGLTAGEAETRAMELCHQVGLSSVATRHYRELSGGEAQRLMLVRSLAAQPQLLLVDEPTAQLDPITSSAVIEALQQLVDPDCLTVVATHDPAVADACHGHIQLTRPA
jgi:putative ABC transport system ATP-binding protein/lipoprotein-releasing system ATP-binding protein